MKIEIEVEDGGAAVEAIEWAREVLAERVRGEVGVVTGILDKIVEGVRGRTPGEPGYYLVGNRQEQVRYWSGRGWYGSHTVADSLPIGIWGYYAPATLLIAKEPEND